MKKILLLLLFVTSFSQAQDAFTISESLRTKLMASNDSNGIAKDCAGNAIMIDFNNDLFISDDEALAVCNLQISNSQLTSLQGIENFTNLRVLNCSYNSGLIDIDISNLNNLEEFYFNNCSVSTIALPNITSMLKQLNGSNNTFTLLNLQNFTSLISLYCYNTSLTSIGLTGCTSLIQIDLSGNSDLTILDFNTLTSLNNVDLSGCTGLKVLLAKNGNNPINFGIPNSINPLLLSTGGLRYICLNETNTNIAILQNAINLASSSCQLNSLCTDTPGGNYNTVKGNLTVNGQLPQSFCKLKFTIGGEVLFTTTNEVGNYRFYTSQTGNFTITPLFENPNAYVSTSLTGSFANAQNNTFIGNFSLTSSTSPLVDVEMMIAPLSTSLVDKRAYLVTLKNKGNQMVSSSNMTIGFDASLGFIPPPSVIGVALDAVNTNTSNWVLTNLAPFESRSFQLFFNDNTSTGQQIDFQANIPLTGDTNPDNNCVISQTQDPAANSIICLEDAVLSDTALGNYLHYMINFENQELQAVNDIIIENTFNPLQFDIASLEIIGSTLDSIYDNNPNDPIDLQPAILDIKDNKATYNFRKGGLGGPGGHGAVLFKIKTKGDLPTGSSVNNSVKITFDYDAPFVTNNEVTTFQNLSVNQVAVDSSIVVYPNPATSIIKVTGDYSITSVQVYDAAGRLLQTNLDNATNYSIDIANKAAGVYFLKITSDKGSKVVRVVKE